MKPKKELDSILLNELQNEFDSNIYEVDCDTIVLKIPEDYGKMPTLEELKTNTNLYEVTQFDYKVPDRIKDTDEYTERLKSYIKNKYNCDSKIYFSLNNTLVNVFLNNY